MNGIQIPSHIVLFDGVDPVTNLVVVRRDALDGDSFYFLSSERIRLSRWIIVDIEGYWQDTGFGVFPNLLPELTDPISVLVRVPYIGLSHTE